MKQKPKPPRGGSNTLAARGLVPVQFVTSPDARRQIGAAAALAGLTVSEWCRRTLEDAAREVIQK